MTGKWGRRAVDALHESTKHGTQPSHPERLIDYRRMDPGNVPDPFKSYRGREAEPLPRDLIRLEAHALEVLSGRASEARELDAEALATLLYMSAGVTRVADGGWRGTTYFRAAMSAGNLHPIEAYVVAGTGIDGVAAGVHHFDPLGFGLTELRSGDHRGQIGVGSPVALVLTGVVWRTAWKYGERGWRHLYWDAGTVLGNLLAAARACGIEASVEVAFDDSVVARLVGIDRIEEMPLALVTLGPIGEVPETGGSLDALSLETAPVAPNPVGLPLVVEAQRESELRGAEVEAWRRDAVGIGTPASESIEVPSDGPAALLGDVILDRGSTRTMIPEPVAERAFDWPMAAATRETPFDASAGTLLSHFVSIHGVADRGPGGYRWTGTDLDLVASSPSMREISARLCLGQELGGSSAYTVFHLADLDQILGHLGSRGYRAAQLEAGIVSERLALCSFTMGLGATGLTFFDDAVSVFFETTADPMLVTAVGVPSTSPARSGTPGEPAALRR